MAVEMWENNTMKKSLICLLGSLFLGGCYNTSGGTSTGNPLVAFKMTGSSQPATVAFNRPNYFSPWLYEILRPAMALPPPTLQDSTGLTINLTEAWIVVKEVEFKASETREAEEVDGSEISFTGPYVISLLAPNPESFGQARVPAMIRRIKMKLHNADILPSTAPVELSGNSIYWKGVVNGHAFSLSSSTGYEYEIAGPNGVSLTDNTNILMSIRIADLFKKVDLSGITTATDISDSNRVPATSPCPTIDASAADLYTCFTKGLQTESNLGNDDDGDDELSGDSTVK